MDRLTIERRGGIAGMKARAVVDIATLDPAVLAGVEALFTLKARELNPHGADRFSYHLVLELGGKARNVTVPEHLFPAALARLVVEEFPKPLFP